FPNPPTVLQLSMVARSPPLLAWRCRTRLQFSRCRWLRSRWGSRPSSDLGDWLTAFKSRHKLLLVVRQDRFSEEVGAALPGAPEGLGATPALDANVIAGEEHSGHARAAELLGPRVLRGFQKAAGERLALGGSLGAERSRQEADDRVGYHQPGQLAPRQHVVADRDRLVGQSLTHALVHALVASGEEDQVRHRCQLTGHHLREGAPSRIHQYHARLRSPQRLDGGKERL